MAHHVRKTVRLAQMMKGKRILAIVVTYYPERDLLVRNVEAFIDHVDKVLIWENTPSKDKQP